MTGKQSLVVEKRIHIQAAPERIWPLISTPEGFQQWFMPGDVKPAEGHEFLLGTPFGNAPCKVLSVQPPVRIAFTWGTLGILSYPHWTITIELKPAGGGTDLVLLHEGWTGEEDAIRERMSGGWTGIVAKLARVAEAG
jgi:uncharacterized protein YndB with AHSA1/START domain